MARQGKQLVEVVLTFASETDLDVRIRAFQAEYEANHGDFLALDQKRPLGPGKAKLTFRIVKKPGKRH